MDQPSLDTQIGNYVPIRFLAHWTLGERFIARAVNASPQDPPVIVDRLWPELARFEGFDDELGRIDHWRRVHHTALAQVLEIGVANGRNYVVSEFFEGRTLESLIQRRESNAEPIPPRVVLELGIQVSQALAALHDTKVAGRAAGLIHGGLNPTRVLLDNRARVKVLGGWSSRLEARLPWAVPPRTVVYQAPEELWGRKVLDRRADLYSLGVVLFEGLIGRFCPSEEPLKFVRRVLRRDASEAPGLEGVPVPIQHLLTRLLAIDPAGRYAEARSVGEDLQMLLEGRTPDRATAKAEPQRPAPEPHAPPALEVPTVKTPRQPAGGPLEPAFDEPAEPDMSLRVTTVVPPVMRQGQPQKVEVMHDPVDRSAQLEPAIVQPPEDLSPVHAPGTAPTAPSSEGDVESLWFKQSQGSLPRAEKSRQKSAATVEMPKPEAEPAQKKKAAPAPTPEPARPEPPKAEPAKPAAARVEPPRPEPVKPEPAKPEPPTMDARSGQPARPAAPSAPEPSAASALPSMPAGFSAAAEPEEEAVEDTGPLALQEQLAEPIRGWLVFREGSSGEYRYPLAGDVVTLGRSSQNTYQILSEIKASRFHCELQFEGGRWLLVDKRSTNGTYVNGQPIDMYELKGREKVNIGFTTFRFLLADARGMPIDAVPERAERPAEPAQRATRKRPHIRAALIRGYGTPSEQRLEVTGDVYLIGRGTGNSLQLEDPLVAPSHCELRYQDGQWLIEDHLSEHGTLVNGFLVDTLALDGGEEITVGRETMRFVLF